MDLGYNNLKHLQNMQNADQMLEFLSQQKYLKDNLSTCYAMALNIIQIDTSYKLLDDMYKQKLLEPKMARQLSRMRNEFAHEIIIADGFNVRWNTIQHNLQQLNIQLKNILGDNYSVIKEVSNSQFQRIDKLAHVNILARNDNNVTINYYQSEEKKIQQVCDEVLQEQKAQQNIMVQRLAGALKQTVSRYRQSQDGIQKYNQLLQPHLSKLKELENKNQRSLSVESLKVQLNELSTQKQILLETKQGYIDIKDSLPKDKPSFFNSQKQINAALDVINQKITNVDNKITQVQEKITLVHSLSEEKRKIFEYTKSISEFEKNSQEALVEFQKGLEVAKSNNIEKETLKEIGVIPKELTASPQSNIDPIKEHFQQIISGTTPPSQSHSRK